MTVNLGSYVRVKLVWLPNVRLLLADPFSKLTGQNKGAGSYSGQGGRIAQKGHPGRRRRIAGRGGKSCKEGILPCSVIIPFFKY